LREKEIEKLLLLSRIFKVKKLSYQKETYQVEKHFEKIRQIGYEDWLREQEKKIKENFDYIEYLEKRGR